MKSFWVLKKGKQASVPPPPASSADGPVPRLPRREARCTPCSHGRRLLGNPIYFLLCVYKRASQTGSLGVGRAQKGLRGPGASVPGPSAHRRRPVPREQWAPTAPSRPPALESTRAQRGKSPDRYLGDHEAIGVVSQQTVAVVLCGSHFLPRWSGFEGPGVSWLRGAQGRPVARGCGRPGGRAGGWGPGRLRLGPRAPGREVHSAVGRAVGDMRPMCSQGTWVQTDCGTDDGHRAAS